MKTINHEAQKPPIVKENHTRHHRVPERRDLEKQREHRVTWRGRRGTAPLVGRVQPEDGAWPLVKPAPTENTSTGESGARISRPIRADRTLAAEMHCRKF